MTRFDDDYQRNRSQKHHDKNQPAGIGFYPCDADMPADGDTTLLPLFRGDAPLTRKIFAFWPESSDSSLQWEFAEALRQNIK